MSATDYTFNDFLTYLLILAANADDEYKSNEIEHIVHFYGDESFMKMSDVYETHSSDQHIPFLKDLKPQFVGEQDFQERVKGALIDIFNSDGEFSDIEQVCLKFLEEELK
jgi:hypothetical protein